MKLHIAILSILVLISSFPVIAVCQSPVHLWSRSFGGVDSDYVYDMAVDAAGNVLVTGIFYETVDFGGGPLVSTGGSDIFVAKYDQAGNHVWSKGFGGTTYDYDYGFGVAVDATGNVLITGGFYDTVDFGGGPIAAAGGSDIYVAKYDQAGNHLWSRAFGGISFEIGRGAAVDGLGNILITGRFDDSVDFGGGPLVNSGGLDVCVAKFDPAGNHLWSKSFSGGLDAISIRDMAVDISGCVLLVGDFWDSVDFGGGVLTSLDQSDVFLVKFDPNGNHLWSRGFGNTEDGYGEGVATDGTGNVYAIGYFDEEVDFGGGTLTSAGQEDIFVLKFDPAGNHLWSQRFGSAERDDGKGIAVDGDGNIVITGSFAGAIDFGGDYLSTAGGPDVYVAKMDSSGDHIWSQGFGDSSNEFGRCVAIGGMGYAFAAGVFAGTVDFGGGLLTTEGSGDIFLTKFSTAPGDVIVNPDGSGIFPNIQAAVDGVDPGDTILLGDGTFTGSGNRDIEFFGKELVIRSASGDASSCILDCEGSLTTPHRGFVFRGGEGSLARIEAITIRNGWASFSGGALDIADGCSPVISDCVLESNTAEYPGNGYGGAVYTYGSPRLERCIVRNNIAGNRGGGIYAGDGSGTDAEIVECVLMGNQAEDGGGLHVRGTASVISCVVAGNTAGWGDGWGGGISCRYHSAPIENCTVVDNTAIEGAGIFLYNSPSTTVTSTIVAFNHGDAGIAGSSLTVACSDLFGNDGGDWVDWLEPLAGVNGNICADPLFCGDMDPEISYYSLGNSSPCRPTANPGCGLIGALPVGCQVTGVEDIVQIPADIKLQQCVPNPFNPQTTISFYLPDATQASLWVYDLSGRLVRTLLNGEKVQQGRNEVIWDARDDSGRRLASGTYFYRLEAGEFSETKKMTLLK